MNLKNLKYFLTIVAVGFLSSMFIYIINNRDFQGKKTLALTIPPEFIIESFGNQSTKNFVTVVCMYFELAKSKHSDSAYHNWIGTMLNSVKAPLVIYTDYNQTYVQSLILKNNLTATIVKCKNIWALMAELERHRNKNYTYSYKFEQNKIDPEAHIHVPELYAIWNIKTYLMYSASRHNPYGSEFFIYSDMGAWRMRQFRDWPDESFVESVAKKLNDRALYGHINEQSANEMVNIFHDNIEGTFFAGSKKALEKLFDAYYRVHDDFYENGIFVGKDQTIMNYLAFYFSKQLIVKLQTTRLNCSDWYDKWFFYQYYFAHRDEYICSEDRLSILNERNFIF